MSGARACSMVSTCVCVARTASRSGPLADLALLDRLEAHLPDGQSLADLPPRPRIWMSTAARRGQSGDRLF